MMEIKKIGILSFAKVQTMLMFTLGIIMGVFEASVSVFYGINLFPNMGMIGETGMMGAWGLIFFPIFYATLGFLFGIFGALIYNAISKWFGGIEVEFEEVKLNPKIKEDIKEEKPVIKKTAKKSSSKQ